jgi:hypothetical protein
MPEYTENFAALRFGGSAFQGEEIWSCGLKLRHLGGDALEPMHQEVKDTIDAVTALVVTYFNNPASKFNGLVRLNHVRLNVIDKTTGKYAFPTDPQERTFADDGPPSGQGLPQVAYCVTMRGLPRSGPAARGRWYVPCEISYDNGRIPVSMALGAANAAGTFLMALGDIDSGDGPSAWNPFLFGDGAGGPKQSAIAQVSVGDVYDTQRRRRNQLAETYSVATTWS